MSGDIVNFNKARKAAARHAKVKKAAENRAKFGATKTQKQRAQDLTRKLQKHLDGHKLGTPSKNDDPSQNDD